MHSNNVIQKSMGWSLFSEIAAKFITPITNMLLARILSPDDFGVLAVCNMLVSFMDIITDAGFGKYLVQSDFNSDDEKYKYANVAFWSNLAISILLFIIIVIKRNAIATFLGNSKYGAVISVASLQLLLTAISSIQTGLFRRTFEFKKLFVVRILVAFTPLAITVPLAVFTKSYWALIIGNLCGAFINAVVLTLISPWKPSMFYSVKLLKKMFRFSVWSLCEGLANWAIFWVDTFIISNFCEEYYVGLYKNSSNMVMSIMGMISASMSPVLLSVLSRVKDSNDNFYDVFLTIQKVMLYLVVPMGAGLFCYRHIITYILFGSKWEDATNIIGCWGLMMTCSVIFYSFTAELYKAKGIPQILFAFQCSYIIFLIPMCVWSIKQEFWSFVYVRCLCVLEQVIMSLIFLKKTFSFNVSKMLKNMINPIVATLSIVISYVCLRKIMNSYFLEFVSMVVSAIIYLGVLGIFFKDDIKNAKLMVQNVKI